MAWPSSRAPDSPPTSSLAHSPTERPDRRHDQENQRHLSTSPRIHQECRAISYSQEHGPDREPDRERQ
jgi:hypothetical protein